MDKVAVLLQTGGAGTRPRRSGPLVAVVVFGLLNAGCSGMLSTPAPPPVDLPASVEWVYWTEAGSNTIRRASLDGSHRENLLPHGLIEPYGIAVAVAAGKIYWADWEVGIQRANLDGSAIETLVHTTRANGIAVDSSRGKIFWTDYGTNKIRRANLDGSGVEDVVVTTLDNPYGIALDVDAGKVYWTDAGTTKIQRASFDGSQVEDLVTVGLQSPRGIALDVARGKLYWSDRGSDKISRANLDGSGVEDLVTPVSSGLQVSRRDGIALDVAAGKLYWSDQELGKIQRANLDGSDIQDVADGLGSPYEIALDTDAGKLYWTDVKRGIWRANLPDGRRAGAPGEHGDLGPAHHRPGCRRRQALRHRRVCHRIEAGRDQTVQPRRYRRRGAGSRRRVQHLRHRARRRRRQAVLG